ncbi:hypothetical protein MGAST_00160 [Mycobacterium gastri 'Wayne']|nr:hypothetical protein MGAST_00160 [Mycobacterium gastri 'Wayne']
MGEQWWYILKDRRQMSVSSYAAIIDFEVYLLMTMRLRMSMADKEAQLVLQP